MKKDQKNIDQKETLSSHALHLRELLESEGWKIICQILDDVSGKLKEMIWTPCVDETPKFSAVHLARERLAAIELIKSLPATRLGFFKEMMISEKENAKPLQDRIKEGSERFYEEMKKHIQE